VEFNVAIERLLGNEGGYVNDPKDPGGETCWGISKRSYPDVNIALLTKEDAKGIYYRDFWSVVNGDELPNAVAFQALDFAVNSGCDTAIRYLQRAAGVADDGHVGPVTLAAFKATPPAILGIMFISGRLSFMTDRKNWPDAGRGWAKRISKDLLYLAEDLL